MSEIKVDTLSTVSGSGNIALSNNVAIQSIGKIGIANGDNLFIASDDTNDVGLKFNGDGNRITPSDALGADRGSAIDLGEGGSAPFKDLYLSGGVFLGGTGATNKLEDYEEGTWTPTIGGSGATYGNQQGIYTKIGRYVNASFDITVNARNSGSTNELHGFPFTTNTGVSPTMGVYSGHISFYSGVSQNLYSLDMYIINGQTYAYFTGHTSATGNIGNSLPVWQNGTRILGTVHYLSN